MQIRPGLPNGSQTRQEELVHPGEAWSRDEGTGPARAMAARASHDPGADTGRGAGACCVSQARGLAPCGTGLASPQCGSGLTPAASGAV